ncbi:RagB/SusD family nutrient uptake outer membrane protein [Neolewinella aurantiaca]|uniref:RagB/SusD family nutrient uptake outer membrane protein n=1 Tax=Neolewinella aurantiaca TaxID=2602767 RepID=A0A5C7FXG6_9BACT|nr:RagB/SusD family nutrient uptake outer membrane protein [Neolewinella aurantiaca]TXF91169.1 RagB/SusD family nutrient uptake outer membrane protein [Neolewinella aurantiaca]
MKNIKFILLASLGFAICSCEDFLNPLPESAVVTDTFYESDADVLAGVIGVYDAIQGVNENTETNESRSNRGVQFEYLLTEHRTDNTRGATTEGSKADFHRYLVNANNVESEDYYQSMYEVIFRSNNIMDFVPEAADEDNQSRYIAELKFLRAYAYFNLVRLYGDVPLVTTVVGPSDNEALFTRVPTVQIYDQIVADLQEAISVLDNTYKARASRAAAQGLLAKVYLTKDDRDYATAAQLCQDIINSGDYSLEEDFTDVFYNELNDEIIFAIQYQVANTLESQSFSSEFTSAVRQGREDGLNILNENLIADFTAFGGDRGDKSYVTIGTSNEVAKFLPEGTDLSTNPPSYGINARNAGNDWIILRYADVLLMHAEAIIGSGNSTSDGAAIDSYMAVRARAGFDPVADRPASISKNDLLTERRVELAFENQRFFDLVRFGVADEVLSAHASEMGYGAYDARKLLLPIPAREINLSEGLLTQNPGY